MLFSAVLFSAVLSPGLRPSSFGREAGQTSDIRRNMEVHLLFMGGTKVGNVVQPTLFRRGRCPKRQVRAALSGSGQAVTNNTKVIFPFSKDFDNSYKFFIIYRVVKF
jgi:hypothetical protein